MGQTSGQSELLSRPGSYSCLHFATHLQRTTLYFLYFRAKTFRKKQRFLVLPKRLVFAFSDTRSGARDNLCQTVPAGIRREALRPIAFSLLLFISLYTAQTVCALLASISPLAIAPSYSHRGRLTYREG